MEKTKKKIEYPSRREVLGYFVSAGFATTAWTIGTVKNAEAASRLALNEDGLYTEHWMKAPSQNLASLFEQGLAQGKYSAILWGNRGCPVCKVMHRDVFSQPVVEQTFTSKFNVYQLNVRGMRFYDIPAYGKMSEMDLSRVQYVRGTPTLIFYGNTLDHATGLPVEMGRLQGRFSIDKLMGALHGFG